MIEKQMEEIKAMFSEQLGLDEVSENSSLKELGLDSLDVVETCIAIKEKYGIDFRTEELIGYNTVGDLLNSIREKLVAVSK